jgi:putative endonuclease
MHSEKRPGAAASTRECSNQERGRLGEAIAALHLEMAGYRILARNLRCGPLEVDLVAARGEVVALVEVRTRSSIAHGRPEETVRWRKRRNLARVASRLHEVLAFPSGSRLRLDLIAIEIEAFGLRLRHLQGFAAPQRFCN